MKDLIGFVVLTGVFMCVFFIAEGTAIQRLFSAVVVAGVGGILLGMHYGYQKGTKVGLREKESLMKTFLGFMFALFLGWIFLLTVRDYKIENYPEPVQPVSVRHVSPKIERWYYREEWRKGKELHVIERKYERIEGVNKPLTQDLG